MAKKTIAKWIAGLFLVSAALGSLHDHSPAFIPALLALSLLIPAIDSKVTAYMQNKGFKLYANPTFKVILGVTLFLFTGAFLPRTPSDTNKTTQNQGQTEANISVAATPKPAPTYDIPALLGKTTDDLQEVLGKPLDGSVPTKTQSQIINVWTMTFEKDGVMIDAFYNIKTKAVEYLFLDGTDKAKLLEQGNLDEKSKDYVIKFSTTNDKVLGVTVAKRLPDDLDASISTSLAGFTIKNNESQDWVSCVIKVNDRKYTYDKIWGVTAGSSHTIAFADLATSDGTRFNVFATKPKDVLLRCNNRVQEGRSGYYTF